MKTQCKTCNWRYSEIGYHSPCPEHAKKLNWDTASNEDLEVAQAVEESNL